MFQKSVDALSAETSAQAKVASLLNAKQLAKVLASRNVCTALARGVIPANLYLK